LGKSCTVLPFTPVAAGFSLFAADFSASPWLAHARLLSLRAA
jgi:hypothetical protein